MEEDLLKQVHALEYALESFEKKGFVQLRGHVGGRRRSIAPIELRRRAVGSTIEALAVLRLAYNGNSISSREGKRRNRIKYAGGEK